MPTATAVKNELDKLAAVVRVGDRAAAGRLSNLGEAVTGGPSADAWALSNIHQVVDADAIATWHVVHRGKINGVAVLEWLRNVLILGPLVVTWFGIKEAVDSYYQLLSAKPSLSTSSFLFLWQGGFEGRTALTLNVVALIDVVILAGVVLLTMLVFILDQRRQSRIAWLRWRIESALSDADLALAERRRSQPSLVIDELRELVVALVTEIKHDQQQRRSEHQDIMAVAPAIIGGAKTMADAALRIEGAVANIASAVAALNHVVQQLAGDLKKLQEALVLVDGAARGLAAQQGDMVGRLDRVTEAVKQLEARLTPWSDALKAAADSVKQQMGQLSKLMDEQSKAHTGLLTALGDERAAQANLATYVSRSNANVENALNEITKMASLLHSAAVDMTDLPRIMNHDLGDMLKQHGDAANSIAQAGSRLDSVIANLDQATRGLAGWVGRAGGARNP